MRSSGAAGCGRHRPKVKKASLPSRGHARRATSCSSARPTIRRCAGWCLTRTAGPCLRQPKELAELRLDPGHTHVLASQTTQDRETFTALEAGLRARFPGLTVLSTICDATRERQEEARSIASSVDVMVIVGGRQSGNTRRLADVAALSGIDTFHVESADELDAKRFAQKTRAGLTAGASTPKSLIDAAENWLTSL